MRRTDWAHTISPFRCVGFQLFGWGFLAAASWRSGYPFAAMTLYYGQGRARRVLHVNRTPHA